jgi:hypothetical protein
VPLNRQSSLTRGLVLGWRAHEPIDLTSGVKPTETGVSRAHKAYAFKGGAEAASDLNFGLHASTNDLHEQPATFAFLATSNVISETALACHTDANSDRGWSVGYHYDDHTGPQVFGLGLVHVAASTNLRVITTTLPPAGSLYTLVIASDSTSAGTKIWVNGAPGTLSASPDATGGSGVASAESLYLGRRRFDTALSHNGRIYVAAIANRVWTAAEALAFHRDPYSLWAAPSKTARARAFFDAQPSVTTPAPVVRRRQFFETAEAEERVQRRAADVRPISPPGVLWGVLDEGPLPEERPQRRRAFVPGASTGFTLSGSAALSSIAATGAMLITFAAVGSAALSQIAASGSAAEAFACSGTVVLSQVACSGSASEAFAATGSAALKSVATSGSGAEAFACSGSAALSSVAASGSAAEAFASSGTGACSSVAASGNAAVGSVFTCSGSAAVSPVACSGATAETFSGTGSAACSSVAANGSGAESFSCSGSAAVSPVACSGSAATGVVFTSSGSAALSPIAASGAGAEAFASTGSAALSPIACTGASIEAFSCSGAAALSQMAASGSAAQGTVFTSSGTAALSRVAASGAGAESFTSSGSAACQSVGATGASAETFSVSGSAALQSIACSGLATFAGPVTGSGSVAISSVGASGSAAGLLPIFCSGSVALSPLSATGVGQSGALPIAELPYRASVVDFRSSLYITKAINRRSQS